MHQTFTQEKDTLNPYPCSVTNLPVNSAKYSNIHFLGQRRLTVFKLHVSLSNKVISNDGAVGILLHAGGFGLAFQGQISNSKMITRLTWTIPKE